MSVRTHFVYLLHDEAGRLLYVGMTRNPRQRRAHHRSQSAWFPEVQSTRMIGPLPQDEASDLERLLILKLGPAHNRLHTAPRRQAFAAWGDLLLRELRRSDASQEWYDRCAAVVASAKAEAAA